MKTKTPIFKQLIILIIFCIPLSSFALLPQQFKKIGIFKDIHPIASYGYPDSETCETDGGIYDGNLCIFQGGTTIEIMNHSLNKYKLSISSIGTNLHFCDFQGEGLLKGIKQIVYTAKKDEESKDCKIVIKFKKNDSLAIITNGKCQYYCGANMSLDVGNAIRVK